MIVGLLATGCSKKDDVPAPATTAPTAPKPGGETPTVALASTVSFTIDADVDANLSYGFKDKKIDVTGPALVFVEGSEAEWQYRFVFYAAGATADCKTKLDIKRPLDKNIALVVRGSNDYPPPAPGVTIEGAFEVHYVTKDAHANSSLYDGAKVKVTNVAGSSITGELSGHSDTGAMTGAGTFTGNLCTNVE